MQTAVPEAMVITDDNEKTLSRLPDEMEKYDVIGLGPGIGLAAETQHLVSFILRRCSKPLVLDADALNAIAMQPEILNHIPPLSILTPHPKEFDRLFGAHPDDFERMKTAENKSRQYGIIIVLKSHHTLIATPDKSYFNSTGNAGMAKGGSGDVLTGIILALVKQYEPVHAALLGVYLHGASGDYAAADLQQECMTATDLITYLSHAFHDLSHR
jgi:NAD(P)H-hydrate epimerase